MVVYLEDGVTAERARVLAEELAGLPAIERSRYVSGDEALVRLREAMSGQQDVLDVVAADMLPRSIEVTLRAGTGDVAAAYPVASQLEATPGVEEVVFAGEWVGKASLLAGGLQRLAFLQQFPGDHNPRRQTLIKWGK